MRRHLAPGGLFAFDVFAPELARCARAEEPEYEEERVADGDAEFITFTSLHRDVATQLMDVTHRHVRMRHGVVVEEAVERYRMRWYHRYELEHLLARAGFEVVAAYGDFDRKPFDRDAREMVFVARSCSSHRD